MVQTLLIPSTFRKRAERGVFHLRKDASEMVTWMYLFSCFAATFFVSGAAAFSVGWSFHESLERAWESAVARSMCVVGWQVDCFPPNKFMYTVGQLPTNRSSASSNYFAIQTGCRGRLWIVQLIVFFCRSQKLAIAGFSANSLVVE